MKILSIDVGIKNLALCILETNNTDQIEIPYWDVINLFEDKIHTCQFNITNKKKNTSKQCNKDAKFHKNGCFYCKSHAAKTEYKLPTTDLKQYKRMKLDGLIKLTTDYNITVTGATTKKNLIDAIGAFIDTTVFENISAMKCNEISLIDIGIAIKEKLDQLYNIVFKNIDVILIENQISPIANRMNCIQGMLSQYFIMKDMTNIIFVSAANKLKNFIGNKKTTYAERKKIGVEETKKILLQLANDNNIDMFNKHKKKDDLADCFLQGVWYKGLNPLEPLKGSAL